MVVLFRGTTPPCFRLCIGSGISGETLLKNLLKIAILIQLTKETQGTERACYLRIPLFENDTVRVWRTVIAPGEPLPVHYHEKPRVAVPLQDVHLKRVFAGSTEKLTFERGKAYWESQETKHESHEVHTANQTDRDIEIVIVEIK